MADDADIEKVRLPLERDGFMRTLIRHLAHTLEDVVGLEEASGYIGVVGRKMGEELNAMYLEELGAERLPKHRIKDVLVNLKHRIRGDFYVISETEDQIVLGNRACPFEDRVLGRTSMCMMTSNVFGVIASDSNGYAKVELQETIAKGDSGCRVVVYLNPKKAKARAGREYFRD